MQDVFGGNGLSPDTAFGERHVFGNPAIQMVTDHQHVQMLFQRVDRVGPRRVGRRRDHVCLAADLDDIRRVTATGAFGVEGMNGAALEGGDGVFDKAGLVERIRVDHHLHVHLVGDAQAAIDGGGRGAPVFMQFQRTGPAQNLFIDALRFRGVALA